MRLNLEALEDRTLPSAPSLPAVFEASPPAAPSVAAISSYVSAMMEQRAQLLATIEQMVIGDYQVLSQEIVQAVYSIQQQVGRFFGIYPNTPNQAFNTAVTQPDSGMGRGNASGSGSGSGAPTTAHSVPNQALNNSTHQTGSGSGSGSSATTTHKSAPSHGRTTVQPLTSGSGSGSATVSGQVWLDNNGDGSLDNGELGFSGIGVMLFDVTTSLVVGSTTSDANGNYSFTVTAGAPPGDNYYIQVAIPAYDEATIEGADSQIDNSGRSPGFALAAGDAVVIPAGIRSMNVTTTDDDANGPIQNQVTLRDAIRTGNNGPPADAVTFIKKDGTALSGTISLGAQQLDPIKTNYNIDGPGASTLTVNGNNNAGTIFTINAGVTTQIYELQIEGGSGNNGGGILNNGNLLLEGDQIDFNSATGDGGGVYNNGSLVLNGVTIAYNQAKGGGGGVANSRGNVTIYGGAVGNNLSGVSGGGIYNVNGGTIVDYQDTLIVQNTATGQAGGGGGVLNLGSKFQMYGGTIWDNSASGDGGGVDNEGRTMTLTGVAIQANGAGKQGGGIFVGGGTLTLTNNVTISADANGKRNIANGSGGGMAVKGGTVKMSGGAIKSNSAALTTAGGAKLLGPGGGILVGGGSLTLTGVSVSKNKGASGGGIAISGGTVKLSAGSVLTNLGNTATSKGGGIYIIGGSLTLTNNVLIAGNTTVVQGGGLYLGNGSTTTFNGATVGVPGKNDFIAGGIQGVYWQNGANVTINNLTDNDDPNGPVKGP